MATYEILYQRRLVKDGPPSPVIDGPQKAVDYFMGNCFDPSEMWREKVFARFLDRMKRASGHLLVGVGDDTSVTISNRLIAKGALDSLANGVILCHNHPSGNPRPGQDDIRATGLLKKALGCLDIELVDHIILGEKAFFSFSDEIEHKYGKPSNRHGHG